MKAKTSKVKKVVRDKITKDMLLGEVVTKYPKTMNVFLKHQLHCAGCGAAFTETVEQGARAHGIDLKILLKDLNKSA